jgi:phosphate transport system ATP-binding protein
MNDACAVNPYTLGAVQVGPACCTPEPHIQLRNVSVAYAERPVLSDVSLDFYRGCITALIGPSGCGKTSLLTTINRMTDLVPSARVSGEILLNGQNITSKETTVRSLRQQVGMIFQKPNPFPLSIRRNLELVLKENGVRHKAELAHELEYALKQVGLWEEVAYRLDAPALSLSGGQQQRLCIARALVLKPQVLLMDEPCSALDPLASAVVEELIVSLRGHYTVVIVTHNLAQARRIANYAAFFWLRERVGKLVEFGQSQKVFERPNDELTAAYIAGTRG